LADIGLAETEPVGEQDRLAVLGERLPRAAAWRVQRHHERRQPHRFSTFSMLPLFADLKTASSAQIFSIIWSCGTGYGARPAAASANASRLASTAGAGGYSFAVFC